MNAGRCSEIDRRPRQSFAAAHRCQLSSFALPWYCRLCCSLCHFRVFVEEVLAGVDAAERIDATAEVMHYQIQIPATHSNVLSPGSQKEDGESILGRGIGLLQNINQKWRCIPAPKYCRPPIVYVEESSDGLAVGRLSPIEKYQKLLIYHTITSEGSTPSSLPFENVEVEMDTTRPAGEIKRRKGRGSGGGAKGKMWICACI